MEEGCGDADDAGRGASHIATDLSSDENAGEYKEVKDLLLNNIPVGPKPQRGKPQPSDVPTPTLALLSSLVEKTATAAAVVAVAAAAVNGNDRREN